LQPHHALESGKGFVLEFHARVIGLVAEAGGHGAFLHLVMSVVRHARAQAQRFNARKGPAQFAPDVEALTGELHHRHLPMVAVVMVMVVVVLAMLLVAMAAAMQVVSVGVAAFVAVAVARQAVARRLACVGRAQVAAIADPREAHAARVGAVEAAGHFAAWLALRRPALAHAVVAGVARHALHVRGQVAGAAGQRKGL
jgi:hypothetical protein